MFVMLIGFVVEGPSSKWLFSDMPSSFSAEPSNTTLTFVVNLSSFTAMERFYQRSVPNIGKEVIIF